MKSVCIDWISGARENGRPVVVGFVAREPGTTPRVVPLNRLFISLSAVSAAVTVAHLCYRCPFPVNS